MTIPIFVINLDRSTDRLAHVRAEFDREGLAFERFPAVDGTNLPAALAPYFHGSPLRPGEVGCYASHLLLWQRIAGGGAALVCEDDISLPAGFAALLRSVLDAAPDGWDVIRMSSPTRRPVVPLRDLDGRHKLVRYWREPTLSGATLVSPKGAHKLCKPGLRTLPIDADLRRPWAFDIDTYGVHPNPVRQQGHPSVIMAAGKRHSYRKLLTPDILWRRLHSLRTLGVREWVKCVARVSIMSHRRAAS